jgi:hypothetical protein
MAKGLVLRVVPLLCGDKRRVEWLVPLLCGDKAGTSPLLCGDKPPAVRGQAPCCAGTSPLLCGDKPLWVWHIHKWGRSRPSPRRDSPPLFLPGNLARRCPISWARRHGFLRCMAKKQGRGALLQYTGWVFSPTACARNNAHAHDMGQADDVRFRAGMVSFDMYRGMAELSYS